MKKPVTKSKGSRKVRRVQIFAFLFLMAVAINPVYGHDGHSDPILHELNDYLMAIQLLRLDDPKANSLFENWQSLRASSWKIRDLTDVEDLTINADVVFDQVSRTRAKQKQLLEDCRAYFAESITKSPAILFTYDENGFSVDSEKSIQEVQKGHRKLLLIEIKNKSDSEVLASMFSSPNDEILFWNTEVTLSPKSSRYSFVILAPLEEKESTNKLTIGNNKSNLISVEINLTGIPSMNNPFRLLPAESVTRVALSAGENQEEKPVYPFTYSISFFISDEQTGKSIATRVMVKDEEGNDYWTPLEGYALGVGRDAFDWGWRTPLWEYQPGPYFYLKGETKLGVDPTGKSGWIHHGFEYLPASFTVPENGKVEVALERWIDMPALGWYSGQTHIHTTDLGIPIQFSRYGPLVSQAEDLHVSAILTLKGEWETHAIYADEYPMGTRETFSTKQHLIIYGEEFRNNPYGHLAFLGLQSLIQPISTGALGELGGPDYPSNSSILDQALDQGATTIAAHFGNFTEYKRGGIQTGWPSTGFEMPIDVALGKVHLAEIMGNGGNLSVWYDLLNCGFKIAATAGPDWFIKDTPRVYVNLEDKDFTVENWIAGLQAGKSFITTGPMLFFKVNGELPGSTIEASNDLLELEVEAVASVPDGNLPIEIIFNGEVISKTQEENTAIIVDDSGWLAVRCEGAHSNPVYINFDARPAGYAKPARKFIKTIDRLSGWVESKALFETESQREEVLSVSQEGKQVYQDIISRAESLNRN